MSRLAVAYTGTLMRSRRVLLRWVPQEALSHVPQARAVAARIRRFVRKHLIPAGSAWIRVQTGWARGLWMQVDLSHERAWWAGTHEPAVQDKLPQLLGTNMVFYDIGANIGFFALAAARLGTRVFAFEPDPENAARLRAHTTRNRLLGQLETVEAALWSESTSSITFRRGIPRSQGGVAHGKCQAVRASGPLIHVRAIKLDDFVSGGRPAPQVIKLDVEGAASEVLHGAIETIRLYRPTLVIEVHTPNERDGVTQFLAPLSYGVSWCIPSEEFPRICFASALPQ